MIGFSDILLKNSDIDVSIMSDLEHEIIMEIIIKEYMSMSEIIQYIGIKFENISDRTIIRKVKELLQIGKISHERIHGRGRRKLYFIKEENTKQDLTTRAFDEESIKAKIYEPIRATITQRNVSSTITQTIQFYRKELQKLKDEPESNYYNYHIAVMSDCLTWVIKLTFAINSGMLGDSKNKLALARRNKERYEEFLQTLTYNIKKNDEDLGNKIIREIYNELVDMWIGKNLSVTPSY